MKRIVLELEDTAAIVLLAQSTTYDSEGRQTFDELCNKGFEGVPATVISGGYLVENLEDKLNILRLAVQELNSKGIKMPILEAYVRSKGISKRDFNTITKAMIEFFRQTN